MPPRTGTSKDGPQAVAEYTYPPPDHRDGELEWINRIGWVADDDETPNTQHTFEVTDGKGGLPIERQPTAFEFRMAGILPYHSRIQLTFIRSGGRTGPYQPCPPTVLSYAARKKPHTTAQ